MRKIKSLILGWLEEMALVRDKTCCCCSHFVWFHGGAGVCGAKNGCPAGRMIDAMDRCDCGCFKKKKRK